ncbi:MAG TPA: hypothetical protein VK952_01220 [Methylotenera sp.]|nr:hypothetical protein [Methylotenera sp.]
MQNKNLKQIFIWPIILGVLSAIGLVVALLEEGALEDISLIGLVAPILVIVYFYWVKKT